MGGLLFVPCCHNDLAKFSFDSSARYNSVEFYQPPILSVSESNTSNYNSSDSDSCNSSSNYSPILSGINSDLVCQGNKIVHVCRVCNKLFQRPSTLKTHMNSHTGERPYFCPNDSCKRSFSVRSNMNRHYRKCPYS